jgi:hypothetical protein
MLADSPIDAWVTVLAAADLNPWGGPGPNFVGRRRTWLHERPAAGPTGLVDTHQSVLDATTNEAAPAWRRVGREYAIGRV